MSDFDVRFPVASVPVSSSPLRRFKAVKQGIPTVGITLLCFISSGTSALHADSQSPDTQKPSHTQHEASTATKQAEKKSGKKLDQKASDKTSAIARGNDKNSSHESDSNRKSILAPQSTPTTAVAAHTVATPPASKNRESAGKAGLQGVLSDTRPDLFTSDNAAQHSTSTGAHTQDNQFAAIGDSWKMLGYLLPTLLIILACLHLLKRFHLRTGRLPGPVQSAARLTGRPAARPSPQPLGGLLQTLLGGFHLNYLNNARPNAPSNMQVIESLAIGGANVHLLEVRGKLLLLGATNGSIRMLAEWEEPAGVGSDDFRVLLHEAAADMDALDLSDPEMPHTAAVSGLEDLMREAGQAVTRGSRRLRTVREVENEDA